MPSAPNRVLIIEDDAGLAELLGDGLAREGLQFATAGTGRAAVAWLGANTADLLLIDYSLPDMTGAALIEELRGLGRLGPFVVITGHGDEEVAVQFMKLGALDYLVKDARLLERLPGAVLRLLKEVATQRRLEAAEEALRESEQRYRQLVDHAPIPIGTHQDGRWVLANAAALAMFGARSVDEVLGTPVLDRVHPDFRELVKARMQSALATGSAPVIEEKLVRFDGTVIDAEVATTAYVHLGRPAVQIVLRDITERKRAEAAQQRSHELLVKLTAQVPGVVYQYRLWLDGHSAFPFASPGMNDIYEVTPEEVREDATPVFGRLHPEDRDRIVADIQESARTLQPFHCEFRVVLPRQGLRWRLSDAMPERTEDGGTLWYGIISDITERKRAEAALRESEERFRAIVENAGAGYFRIDRAGRFSAVNEAWLRMHGFAHADEIIGRTFAATQLADEVAAAQAMVATMLAGGSVPPGEFQRRLKDGTTGYHTFSVHPVRQGGEIAGLEGFLIDTTAARKAQAALARDEAELAAIYDHAPIMMLLIDGERKVRRLNRTALRFAGKMPDESVGLRGGDLLGCLHALDDPRGCGFGVDCSECVLRRTILDTLETGTSHQRVEAQSRLVRGHELLEVNLRVSTARMLVADEAMVLLCLEDVSQQKSAEQRVREQAALLDVTRDAIMVFDLDGVVTYWNRGAELLYLWPAAEALGQPFTGTLCGEPTPEAAAAIRAIQSQGQWTGELRQRNRGGVPLITLCRGVLMQDATGEARSVLFTASDITEAKQFEAQLLRAQRLESLGSLASGVAHDLNNVLTPILMSTGLLAETARTPHDREMVQLLGDSARRGADIVQQLLLFGRGSDSPRAPTSVAAVIKDVVQMMRGTFPKALVISAQMPKDLWTVVADRTQIHQVLLNLCVNARDAMPAGGKLSLRAENVHVDPAFAARQTGAKPGPHVAIRVTDTGSGIPPALVEKIFEPFFTTKPIGVGTGLGLATVLGIARSHGGFVTVESQEGTGSEFGIFLPAQAAAVEAAAAEHARPNLRGHGELVLVIDDEAAIRSTLSRVLGGHGYQVVVAGDGAAGIAAFTRQAKTIRLVITDLMMPVMDGARAIQALRRLSPTLPVIAISGVPSQRAELTANFGPHIRFLPKPFLAEDALALARELLDAPASPAGGEDPPARP